MTKGREKIEKCEENNITFHQTDFHDQCHNVNKKNSTFCYTVSLLTE